VIEAYVFWDVHQPEKDGELNFSDNFDLLKFLHLCQDHGLFVNLRIGPYVCAEWNAGGIPVWVREIDGMVFRSDNEPWKREMKTWMERVVNLMNDNNMWSNQGGPIILAQVENEYGNVEFMYALEGGHKYMEWAVRSSV